MKIQQIRFGLIGKRLDYSFSKNYFETKFANLKFKNYSYENIELLDEAAIALFCKNEALHFKGLNVTIPYKESIIKYLDQLDKSAEKIGAVNTLSIKKSKLIGHNTDYIGFRESIKPYLQTHHDGALILGTGGASKAVVFALEELNIKTLLVSRQPNKQNQINYNEIDTNILQEYPIIVNTTPIGTYPMIEEVVDIPFSLLNKRNLVYDLVYNPAETKLMQLSKMQGAFVLNGLSMLILQAEQAWKIWNEL